MLEQNPVKKDVRDELIVTLKQTIQDMEKELKVNFSCFP